MIAIYTQNRQAVWNFADISRFHVTGNGTGIQAVAKNGAGGELARYKNREQCTYVLEMLMSAFDADERTFVFPTEKELEHAKQHSQEEVRGMVVLDHIADSGKKAERTAETAQNTSSCAHKNDLIFRQTAIDAMGKAKWAKERLEELSSAQPDNQTNLCDSCDCSYPDCPSKYDDVIFGNGIGNDNICACNKYKPSAQPEQKKDEWIPISKETNPTKSGWYLVTVHEDATNDNERFTGMAEFNAINGMWYDIDEPTDMYLRWMPLPAPYRGGEMT